MEIWKHCNDRMPPKVATLDLGKYKQLIVFHAAKCDVDYFL